MPSSSAEPPTLHEQKPTPVHPSTDKLEIPHRVPHENFEGTPTRVPSLGLPFTGPSAIMHYLTEPRCVVAWSRPADPKAADARGVQEGPEAQADDSGRADRPFPDRSRMSGLLGGATVAGWSPVPSVQP